MPLLVSIQFNNIKLDYLDPDLLQNVKFLRSFNAIHSKIFEIPANFFNATAYLSSLNLSHNYITDIPQNLFKQMKYLTDLKVSHNKLTVFDDNFVNDLINKKEFNLFIENNLLPTDQINNLLKKYHRKYVPLYKFYDIA